MQDGKLDPEIAFLNASLIPDVFPVLAAAHKTLIAKSRESLTTRTLRSELVYDYSGSKHVVTQFSVIRDVTTAKDNNFFRITESLKRCVFWSMKAVEKLIKGKEIDLEELEGRADQAQIQKHYKISGPELGESTFADGITYRIAARDAL
ncbi:hypothetical protein CRYUN_Cryun04dG0054300 [Craigia yunnanensis]